MTTTYKRSFDRANCYFSFFFSFFSFQTPSTSDQRRRGVRGEHSLGAGWYPPSRLDPLLLLHLERCQVDREGGVLHIVVPLRSANDSSDSWNYIARSHGGHSILHQSKSFQTERIRGKRDNVRYVATIIFSP